MTSIAPLKHRVDITLRLNDAAYDLVQAGDEKLEILNGTTKNRAAWFRMLIDFSLSTTPMPEILSATTLHKYHYEKWFDLPTPHRATFQIEEEHRIQIRQFECYAQGLNWSHLLQRNEACLVLICESGPWLNRHLDVQIHRKNKLD